MWQGWALARTDPWASTDALLLGQDRVPLPTPSTAASFGEGAISSSPSPLCPPWCLWKGAHLLLFSPSEGPRTTLGYGSESSGSCLRLSQYRTPGQQGPQPPSSVSPSLSAMLGRLCVHLSPTCPRLSGSGCRWASYSGGLTVQQLTQAPTHSCSPKVSSRTSSEQPPTLTPGPCH